MAFTWSDQERITLQGRIVTEHTEAENTHEYDRVNAAFVQADRACYQVVPGAIQYDGIQGVESFYELLDKALPDLEWKVTHEYDVPGCSIREGTTSGTHSVELAEVPASRNPISFEVCALHLPAPVNQAFPTGRTSVSAHTSGDCRPASYSMKSSGASPISPCRTDTRRFTATTASPGTSTSSSWSSRRATRRGRRVRYLLARAQCCGHEQCAAVAPQVHGLDESTMRSVALRISGQAWKKRQGTEPRPVPGLPSASPASRGAGVACQGMYDEHG